MIMQPREILDILAARGLLLVQDKSLPSVVGIVTGESVRGSWWSHPKGRLVFRVLSQLGEHPDVLFTKLVFGKQTLMHRSLWPALLAVAGARAAWQTQGLSREARRILERADQAKEPVLAAGRAVKELESRLLVTTREVHTESGRHAMAVEGWKAWSRRVQCRAKVSEAAGRKSLEDAAAALGAPLDALPWANRRR